VSRVGGKAQLPPFRAVAGDLKLAYAQFEELESFDRFGARLDDDTRQSIEHGRRIRACLKQAELSPVSVPAQIAILLALGAKLFDLVPMERMEDAERAVLEAASKIPTEVDQRLETGEKLSDEDRAAIVAIARKALEPFQPKPAQAEAPASVSPAPRPGAEVEAKKSRSVGHKAKPEPEPVARTRP